MIFTFKELCKLIVKDSEPLTDGTRVIGYQWKIPLDLFSQLSAIAKDHSPVEPISPADLPGGDIEGIPGFVIEAFNEEIARNWRGSYSRFRYQEVVSSICNKGQSEIPNLDYATIERKGWLGVQDIFVEKGWGVTLDQPQGGGDSYFRFTDQRKEREVLLSPNTQGKGEPR